MSPLRFHILLVLGAILASLSAHGAFFDGIAERVAYGAWFVAMPLAFAYAGRVAAGHGPGLHWAQLAAWIIWIVGHYNW